MVGLGIAAVQLFVIFLVFLIFAIAGWITLRLLRLKRESTYCAVLAAPAACLAVWAYVSIWGSLGSADRGFVSGHEFTRADMLLFSGWALAPAPTWQRLKPRFNKTFMRHD